MTTRELFDKFFEGNPNYKNRRNSIDRKELFAFEDKIGKQLVEMSPQEILDAIQTFGGKYDNPEFNFGIGYDNYANLAVLYRAFFDWYIDNIEVIKNPFRDKMMKESEAGKYLLKGKDCFTQNHLDKIFAIIRRDYLPQRADYLECIMRLFLEGVSKYEEIIYLTEDMLDFENHLIRFPNRNVSLSERTIELLKQVNMLTQIEGERRDYPMTNWRGGYFKFITHKKMIETFDENDAYAVQRSISRLISEIGKEYGFKLDEKMLYMFGFYNKLVERFGEDQVRDFVYLRKNSCSDAIKESIIEYGVPDSNITTIKKRLKQFIKPQ